VFNQQWQLLIAFGGHGLLPGQFQGLVNIASDNKHNHIITSEIYPGRVQEFRYITDAEADQMRKEREVQRANAAAPKKDAGAATASAAPPAAAPKDAQPK
jgi:hypothetical protein